MKSKFFFINILFLFLVTQNYAQSRRIINLPNILGYITLKGDFHMHTPYSDGTVWPSDRVLEAWRDGLDVIAITDHLEYNPNKSELTPNLNRPYEIAKKVADEYGILLIRAAEITRSMPPGHFNAYFLKDVNALKKANYMDAFKAAADQGAFFVWNHPGWKVQQPDTMLWFPKHTELYEKGYLNGIEIYNDKTFYPLAQQWAMEKNLAIFGNSDIHGPIDFNYLSDKDEKRPFNLIFVKERSVEGVRDAFINKRTASCFKNKLVGRSEFLLPLVMQSIEIQTPHVLINEKNSTTVLLSNPTDFPFDLTLAKSESYTASQKFKLEANGSIAINLSNIKGMRTGENEIKLNFKVKNVLIDRDKSLEIEIKITAFAWKNIRICESPSKDWKINCVINPADLKVYYTTNGSIPTSNSTSITQNFAAKDSVLLKMAAFRDQTRVSEVFETQVLLHQATGQKVSLKENPDKKYFGDGASTLTDGMKGSDNHTDGHWLGFLSKDFEATIEFDHPRTFKAIAINFLENHYFWLFLPKFVDIQVSTDGIAYKSLGKIAFAEAKDGNSRGLVKAEINKQASNIKYIKVIAKNIETCPAWHQGKGKSAWLFVDELIVK